MDRLEELRGQTALVTGASRGIGRAVAGALVEAGAWVAMVAREESALRAAAEEIGGHAVPADVSSAPDVHRVAAYLAELLGDAPDLLVNAAGAFALAPIAETDPHVFDEQVAVNLRGPFLLVRAFLPLMLQRGSGHLISIGSVAGRLALPGNGAYGASMFGLRGLHEVLALEIRGTGVCATLIEPAATDPPLPAEEVARAVLFAAAQPREVEIPLLAIRSTE